MESLANTMIIKDAISEGELPKAGETEIKVFSNIYKFTESANQSKNLVFYKEDSNGGLQFGFHYDAVNISKNFIAMYKYAMICLPNNLFFSNVTSLTDDSIFKNGAKRVNFIPLADCEFRFNSHVLLKKKFFNMFNMSLLSNKVSVSLGNTEYGYSIPGAYCLLIG